MSFIAETSDSINRKIHLRGWGQVDHLIVALDFLIKKIFYCKGFLKRFTEISQISVFDS